MIKKIIEKFKNNYEKYPTTIIIINLLSILFSIWIIWENDDLLNYGCLFLFLSSINSFFIESTIKNKKIIYITITTIISIIFTIFINEGYEYIQKLSIFYIVSLPLIGIYSNYKKSKDKFYEYVTNVIYNTLVTSIIYGILALGVLLISLIFNYLIYDSYKIILIFEVLVAGFYLLPSIVCNFINKEKIIDLMELLVRKVLVVLLALAYIIIYLYILKMIITLNVPRNMVFTILACVFFVSIFISLLMDYYKEKNIFDKFNYILKYLNCGFIILQAYCIIVRIVTSGLTTTRYLALLVLIFEIIYLIYRLLNKDLSILLFYVIGMFGIALLVPYVNMFKLPCLVEYNIVKNYDSNKEYSKQELKKIVGAYEYLEYNDAELFNKIVNIIDVEKFKEDFIDESEYAYYRYEGDLDLNISNYTHIREFDESNYYFDENDYDTFEIFAQFTINNINVNIYDEVLNYVNKDSNYFQNNNIINIDGYDIYLKVLDINYEGNNITYYNLSGFILEK